MRLCNEQSALGSEGLGGLLTTVPALCRIGRGGAVVRRPSVDRVSVVAGGGAGHEPAHVGLVGQGLLTAAVAGAIFSSPSTDEVLAALRLVTGPKGALVIIKNYTGDRLHFGLAVELARSEGLQIETVVVADDCALIDQGLHAGRRGLAGTVLVHKVAGAAAEAGLDLAQVKRIAQLAAESIGTVGVGFSACTLPSTGLPAFHMKDDEMEVGLGIHGEPGVERVPRCSVKDLVPKILDPILKSKPFSSATDIALFVNNLGTSTTLELYNLSGHAISYLSDRGYSVKKVMVGSFLTSLDMNGVSVTLMVLTSPELIKHLEAPVEILTPWSMIDRVDCDVEFKSICINYATEIESKTRASHEHHHHEQIAQANQMLQQCLEAVCLDLQSYSDQLTELDSQVGDGDLGTNISNLVEGLSAACESLCVLPAAEFMKRVGLQCRGMGGSCGALLGIMFVAMGNSYQTLEGSERRKWIHALKVGIETMKTVGDTHEGDCTMVDALMPALRILEKYTHSDEPEQLPRILEIAATASLDGAETTRDLIAKRGRASYLGSRSLGVMDPGALAVSVVFASISRVFAEACGAAMNKADTPKPHTSLFSVLISAIVGTIFCVLLIEFQSTRITPAKAVHILADSCDEMRNVSSYLKERTVTLAVGGRRSASTWQFTALINIGHYASVQTRPLILFDKASPSMQAFPKRKFIQNYQNIILKSFHYDAPLDLMGDYVFTSFRDLRDQLASIIKANVKKCAERPEKLHRECRLVLHHAHANQIKWSVRANYSMKYETFLEKPALALAEIMDVLGVAYDQKDLQYILKKTNSDLSAKKTDQSMGQGKSHSPVRSSLRTPDSKPGYYKSVLSKDHVDCVNLMYGSWLSAHGYAVETKPALKHEDCRLVSPDDH